MTKIAVLALTEFEHQHLIEVWKFFPFSSDTVWHYLYLGSDDSSVLPSGISFVAKHFPGDAAASLSSLSKYLAGEDFAWLCFGGRSSYDLWTQCLNQPALTVYQSRQGTLLDISGYPDWPQGKAGEQISAQYPRMAVLKSEHGQFPAPAQASVYQDYHSYSQNGNAEALLTRNTDLLSAVCANDSVEYTATHVFDSFSALDLGIGRATADFNLTLFLLRQLSQSAAAAQPELKSVESATRQVQKSYSFFAGYYDNYMSHVDYNDWLALMLGWYKQHSKHPMKKVLEIACGTANASEILVFRGYEVDACDSSPLMLHYADAKVFKPNLFYGSMTDSLPRKEYDFAFCLFDSINYLTQKNDIKTLFKNVSASLRPGGVFIFDISTLLNSLQNFNETIHFTRVKDGYMIHDSRFEVLSNKQITHFTLFRKHGSIYYKLEEHHVQRVYRCPELAEMIAASPLNLKAIHVPELRANLLPKLATDLDNRHTRIFFVLQKPK